MEIPSHFALAHFNTNTAFRHNDSSFEEQWFWVAVGRRRRQNMVELKKYFYIIQLKFKSIHVIAILIQYLQYKKGVSSSQTAKHSSFQPKVQDALMRLRPQVPTCPLIFECWTPSGRLSKLPTCSNTEPAYKIQLEFLGGSSQRQSTDQRQRHSTCSHPIMIFSIFCQSGAWIFIWGLISTW